MSNYMVTEKSVEKRARISLDAIQSMSTVEDVRAEITNLRDWAGPKCHGYKELWNWIENLEFTLEYLGVLKIDGEKYLKWRREMTGIAGKFLHIAVDKMSEEDVTEREAEARSSRSGDEKGYPGLPPSEVLITFKESARTSIESL